MPVRTTASTTLGYRLWLFAAMGGAALIIAGSLLPWATLRVGALTITRQGTDGAGVQTLLMGAAALVMLAIAIRRGTSRGVVLALSLLVLLLAAASVLIVVVDVRTMAQRLAEPTLPRLPARLLRLAARREIVEAGVGLGVYLTAAGAALAALAAAGAMVHAGMARTAGGSTERA